MTHLTLLKTPGGFAPADPDTQEFHSKLKLGESIHGEFKRLRNAAFHRKFFALLNYAFDAWEPPELETKWGDPEKSFDRFRKDVTILAGYYHNVFRLDGSFRIEADSISFGSMDNETFSRLYQNVITVLIKRIPAMGRMSAEEVDEVVNKILEFS